MDEDLFALRIVEDGPQHRGRSVRGGLREERDNVLVRDAVSTEQLIDLRVAERAEGGAPIA